MFSPLIFFGNERLSTGFELQGAPTLEALLAHGYNVKAVVSHYEAGRSRKNRPLEIAAIAEAHHIPLFLPEKLGDIKDELIACKAEAAVLVAYGKMVSEEIINIFPKGIINIHPSLLPHYRGPTPVEQAMLDGVRTTGVSLMKLVKTMDAGPVFAQTNLSLSGTENKQELTEALLRQGGELLIEHLPAILEGSLTPTPQDEINATYCNLLSKDDSIIDFTLPAERIARQVRAFAGWPQSKAILSFTNETSVEAIITEAVAVPSMGLEPGQISVQNDGLYIGTRKDALAINRLKIPGKKEITAAEFIRGYHL